MTKITEDTIETITKTTKTTIVGHPTHFIFMLDESGSMTCDASRSPAKYFLDKLMNKPNYSYFEVVMKYLRDFLDSAIGKSTQDDRCSVVSWASGANVRIDAKPIKEAKTVADAGWDMRYEGTNFYPGISMGFDQAQKT